MNQKEALKKLNDKRKYIDDEVFQIISNKIKADISKEVKEENDKFTNKVLVFMKEGYDVMTIKNMILSDLNQSKLSLLREGVVFFE